MSFEIYDEAMEKKFEAVFPNSLVASPDEVFVEYTSKFKKELELPLLSLYRTGMTPYSTSYNHNAARRGETKDKFDDEGLPSRRPTKSLQIRHIPVSLEYQIDMWGKARNQVDQLFRELLFMLEYDSQFGIKIPGVTDPYMFTIRFESFENNTGVGEFPDVGRLYRYTMIVTVDEARIFAKKCVPLVHTIIVEMEAEDYAEVVSVEPN